MADAEGSSKGTKGSRKRQHEDEGGDLSEELDDGEGDEADEGEGEEEDEDEDDEDEDDDDEGDEEEGQGGAKGGKKHEAQKKVFFVHTKKCGLYFTSGFLHITSNNISLYYTCPVRQRRQCQSEWEASVTRLTCRCV